MDDLIAEYARQFLGHCSRLGVRAEWPYTLSSDAHRFYGLVYVHEFGGPRGCLVLARSPDSSRADDDLHLEEEAFFKAATASGFAASIVSLAGHADEQMVKDTLDDWQYFGPSERRPAWYTGTPWGMQPPRPKTSCE